MAQDEVPNLRATILDKATEAGAEEAEAVDTEVAGAASITTKWGTEHTSDHHRGLGDHLGAN